MRPDHVGMVAPGRAARRSRPARRRSRRESSRRTGNRLSGPSVLLVGGPGILRGGEAVERLLARRPARRPSSSGRCRRRPLAVDHRRARKVRSCGGPCDVEHVVDDLPPLAGELLLELGLVVDVGRQRVGDAAVEGGDDRLADRLEPVLRGRAPPARPRAAPRARSGCARAARARPPARAPRPRSASRWPEPELPRDDGAARTRDDVRADLRHPALGEVRIALVERARDRQLEHAVAEELEPLVRRRAVGRPGAMREDGLQQLVRQLVDEPRELRGTAARGSATGAWRRSRRLARRSGSSGRPRPRS